MGFFAGGYGGSGPSLHAQPGEAPRGAGGKTSWGGLYMRRDHVHALLRAHPSNSLVTHVATVAPTLNVGAAEPSPSFFDQYSIAIAVVAGLLLVPIAYLLCNKYFPNLASNLMELQTFKYRVLAAVDDDDEAV